MSFFMKKVDADEVKPIAKKVWVPDAKTVWKLCDIESQKPDSDTLVCLVGVGKQMKKKKFKVAETHGYDVETDVVKIENIAYMEDMHAAPLLQLLRRRYTEDMIYCFVGDMTLSINPYKRIKGNYDFSDADRRPADPLTPPRPHVFATANRAYSAMLKSGMSQSILVNGESGAGKTEASKVVMRFLAYRSELARQAARKLAVDSGRRASTADVSESTAGVTGIEESFMATNPIIEGECFLFKIIIMTEFSTISH